MPGLKKVPLPARQALNEAIVYVSRAPKRVDQPPGVYVRALRGALRMSQAQLARRAGLPQSHVARLESGQLDARLGTWRRLFDAMFCALLVLPRPRKRPGDALADRQLETRQFIGSRSSPWA